MNQFQLCINGREWELIKYAPRDGRMVFVRDHYDHVDIAAWDGSGEWNCEMGCCSEIVWFTPIFIMQRIK